LSVGKHRSRFAAFRFRRRAPFFPRKLEGQLSPATERGFETPQPILNDTGIRDLARSSTHCAIGRRTSAGCRLPEDCRWAILAMKGNGSGGSAKAFRAPAQALD